MLNKIIEKRNYIIFIIIIILLTFITISTISKVKAKSKTYDYFDEKITIEIYTNKKTKNIFKNIDKMFKKYNEFYENPNTNKDKELIKLLKYGKTLYKKTNGYIDITSYKLLTNVKNDKTYDFKTSINELNLKDKNTIINMNIESIIGSYVVRKIENYLKQNSIDSYIIKEDSNIITGKSYNNKKFNIPIIKDGNIVNIISIENKSVAIKGDVDTFKPYMVNPITSTKNKDNKLVIVISDNINEANFIADTIYLMKNDEIENYVKKYKVEAMWYINDKPLKTKEFKSYEYNN